MSTHRDYFGADKAAIWTAIRTNLGTAYMRSTISANWRGWRNARQELDVGTAGTINDPSCGAIYHLQLARPPAIVADQAAAPGRWYSLIVYLRTQLDPLPSDRFVDTFDEAVKNQLAAAFDSDTDRSIFSDVPWAEQERTDTTIDTTHILNVACAG